jgi:AraC-like DNA-binding protein
MPKSIIMKKAPRVYNEERFRTPLAQERELGLWVDRIGWMREDRRRPARFRVLGQYAAVAVQEGTGVLETLAHGTHAVGAGDVMVVSPPMATRYYPGATWATRWVVWNGPEADVLERFSGLGGEGPVIRGGAAATLKAWQRLDPLMDRQDFESLLGRKLALLELIRDLSAQRRSEGKGGQTPFLEAALRLLSDGGGAPESMAALARLLHVSPAHFRRLFKAHTGISPKAFQVAQRMTRAKALLAEGRSIKEAAERLGFADVFHFMRLFRRVTGQTAGQFADAFSGEPVESIEARLPRRDT